MSDAFRVLVIDDDPGVREYLQALMSRQGYQVFAEPGGEDALRNLNTSRPDLVTLDVVLDVGPGSGSSAGRSPGTGYASRRLPGARTVQRERCSPIG